MPFCKIKLQEDISNQLRNLKSEISRILTENPQTNYVAKFLNHQPTPDLDSNEYTDLVVDSEYGLIGKLIYDLAKNHSNFKVIPPKTTSGIGFNWVVISEDVPV